MPKVKVCGVTSVADAVMCVEEGADAIGLNFVPASARRVDEQMARDILAAVGRNVLVVGVLADMSAEDAAALRDRLGLGCLQLHGSEPPAVLAALLPHAYKALRVGSEADVARADEYPGEHVLLDGVAPGTGRSFEWSWARAVASRRKLTLAGGLHAGNVADAIRVATPYCVDVASGVEPPNEPRHKDRARLRAFVAAAH